MTHSCEVYRVDKQSQYRIEDIGWRKEYGLVIDYWVQRFYCNDQKRPRNGLLDNTVNVPNATEVYTQKLLKW